eukprot:g4161.t1
MAMKSVELDGAHWALEKAATVKEKGRLPALGGRERALAMLGAAQDDTEAMARRVLEKSSGWEEEMETVCDQIQQYMAFQTHEQGPTKRPKADAQAGPILEMRKQRNSE